MEKEKDNEYQIIINKDTYILRKERWVLNFQEELINAIAEQIAIDIDKEIVDEIINARGIL